MNETMQSLSFHHTSITANGGPVRDLHPVRPTSPAPATRLPRESFRDRIRAALTRTTLGPVGGDHALGESQWRSDPSGFAA